MRSLDGCRTRQRTPILQAPDPPVGSAGAGHLHELLRSATGPLLGRPTIAEDETTLGRDHDLVPATLHRAPEHVLARPTSVDIRSVEHRHAQIDSGLDQPDVVGHAPIAATAEADATEPDPRHRRDPATPESTDVGALDVSRRTMGR